MQRKRHGIHSVEIQKEIEYCHKSFVKDYKPDKAQKDPKPRKLHECGHVESYKGPGGMEYNKCGTLTSKQVTLANGMKVFLCPTHEKRHE